MIMIARDIAGVAVEDVIRLMGETIPDAFALAIFVPCAFYLV
jgi:hypothetical protein